MDEEKNTTTDNEQIATEEEIAKLIETLTGLLRESEKLLADAVPQGPMATLIALTTIINELQRCWDHVAGIVIPDCGNLDCPIHGMPTMSEAMSDDRPTEVDLHDADPDPDDDIDF